MRAPPATASSLPVLLLLLLVWWWSDLHDGFVLVEASARSSLESAYDTNKGVFSPQGRLVQLDYVEVYY